MKIASISWRLALAVFLLSLAWATYRTQVVVEREIIVMRQYILLTSANVTAMTTELRDAIRENRSEAKQALAAVKDAANRAAKKGFVSIF